MTKPYPKFSQRALAYAIDLLSIYLLTITVIFVIVGTYLALQNNPRESWNLLKENQGYRAFQSFAHLMIYLSYFSFSYWSSGKTLGKSFFKLQVVSESGELTFKQSLGRSLAYFLSGQLTFGIGFLLPLFRQDKKALHDLLAKTKVVRITQKIESPSVEQESSAA